MGAKKLRLGLLDWVQAVLLALVSKLLLLPAAVLERTQPATHQALVRAHPLQVQVQELELELVQQAVVHLKLLLLFHRK